MTTYGPAPIDLLNDSPAVRDYKAGAGWLWYALRNAGMTDEQIANSLATYDASVKRVALEDAADLIRDASLGHYPSGMCPAVSTAKGAASLIDPRIDSPEYLTAAIERAREAWKGART
ncbi:hypothetical protein [Streptomyces sp. SID2119]|uniref:hypothetical protein n=1 Tax=Streptomyces sp. SID2119 TaxID=2690253 RepID=UPI00136A0488|nr:hypothetical protein [Streptomyces sp. SID2119]MYW28328.1 hypothetical protein [Streptomyces sp. SID2119]